MQGKSCTHVWYCSLGLVSYAASGLFLLLAKCTSKKFFREKEKIQITEVQYWKRSNYCTCIYFHFYLINVCDDFFFLVWRRELPAQAGTWLYIQVTACLTHMYMYRLETETKLRWALTTHWTDLIKFPDLFL